MKFGISVPNCVEGMAFPIPFAGHGDVIRVATEAERLGFDSILANDHWSTQNYVRDAFPEPPRYYEPLIMLAHIAAKTETIRLVTGVIVLPLREPVLFAKQVATLDQVSGGRVTLGVGVGAYREEFEAVRPAWSGVARAELVEEGLASIRLLFGERRASFSGKHIQFADVEMFPKPVQQPLPIFSCGNAAGTMRRAARYCDGWMPAGLPREALAAGIERVRALASEQGRTSHFEVCPQLVACLADSDVAAQAAFAASQAHEHLVSLRRSTMRDIDMASFMSENLIGTPDEVVRRLRLLREAGADGISGIFFAVNTVDEYLAQMRRFARDVMPALKQG
jgi:probable F420-dependent oxidoreductase